MSSIKKQISLSKRDYFRKFKNKFMLVMITAYALFAIIPLFLIFIYTLKKGLPALDLNFFINLPAPVGEVGGGMANSIIGTIELVFLASLISIPVGIAAGVYLSEYGTGKLGNLVRFIADTLTSTPSIIVGLFAYAVLVVPLKKFSLIAGAFSLSIIMLPIIVRTTEELLKLIPTHIREAGLALGLPRWKVILHIIVKGSMGPLFTGVMLAVARASGESAPLLFTALNNQFWSKGLFEPSSSIPVQIYTYAISPYEDWHRQAWAGALVLIFLVFILNLSARLILHKKVSK